MNPENVALLQNAGKSYSSSNESIEPAREELEFDYDDSYAAQQSIAASRQHHSWIQFILNRLSLSETSSQPLSNEDLKPVESARRTWTWSSYALFWIADSFNINTIQIASTGLQNGKLTPSEVTLSIFLGYFLASLFVQLSARMGAFNHISFPVTCRLSFGIQGAMWPVINRVVMATVWYAVQSWIGGQCVQLMIKAVLGIADDRGNNQGNWQDHFAFELAAFGIFWVVSLFVVLVPPHKLKNLFQIKAYMVPVASLGLLGWVLIKARKVSPEIAVVLLETDFENDKFWTFVTSTMNCLANFATLIVNAPDFSRFAHNPQAIKYANIVSIPTCFTLTSIIGIVVSSASRKIYSVAYWSPLDVLDRLLKESGLSFVSQTAIRIGVFFISTAFMVAVIGTNASANSICVGTDLSSMLPRYINIKRGGLLCAFFSLLVQPWRFFESSSKFTLYLSAYSVFLSSIAGVMIADYYIVRRGHVNLKDMYIVGDVPKWNWKAYIAYTIGMVPNIPGFLLACGVFETKSGPFLIQASKIYHFSYFVGFFLAASVYSFLCWKWPIDGQATLGWKEQWKQVEDFDSLIYDSGEMPISAGYRY